MSSRNNDLDWIVLLDSLYQLLEDKGPMSMREVEKALELSSGEIDVLLMIFPEEFQKLTFAQVDPVPKCTMHCTMLARS